MLRWEILSNILGGGRMALNYSWKWEIPLINLGRWEHFKSMAVIGQTFVKGMLTNKIAFT